MPSGHKGKLYINTGTTATPVLVLIGEARDVDFTMSLEKEDDSDRNSDFKKYVDGQADLAISWKMTVRNQQTNYSTLIAAMLAGTILEFMALDGLAATTGSEGPRFYGKVFQSNGSQPLSDSQTADLEAAPTHYEEPAGTIIQPAWYEAP